MSQQEAKDHQRGIGAEGVRQLPNAAPATPAGQHDLHSFIGALRRRAPLVLLTVALGLGAAFIYLYLATPQYTATARIIIDNRGGKIFDAGEVVSALNTEIATIESQVEILRSRRIAEKVLSGANGDLDVRLRELTRATTIERQGLSFVVDVSFRSEDRAQAAQIANALVDAYQADQVDLKQQATRNASERLKSRAAQAGADLFSIEKRVQVHLISHGSVEAAKLRESRLAISEKILALGAARARSAELQARRQEFQELAAAPEELARHDETFDSGAIADVRRRLIASQSRRDTMLSRFDEQHASVKSAHADLNTVKRDIVQEANSLLRQIAIDAGLNDKQVKTQEEDLDQLSKAHAAQSFSALSLAELEREAEATKHLQAALLKRLKETEAQQDLQVADARVIAYATPPNTPSYPRPTLTLVAALFGSLLLGVVAALVRENLA